MNSLRRTISSTKTLVLAIYVYCCIINVTGRGSAAALAAGGASMWQRLTTQQPARAWKAIFGEHGQRGEYMDGYSKQSMIQRCTEDYKWGQTMPHDAMAEERAKLMSHLYDNEELWASVNMVAFAEHYILDTDDTIRIPFQTFQRHQQSQLQGNCPIFGGVIFSDWQSCDDIANKEKLATFKKEGIDYVRLECNLGTTEDIGGVEQLASNPLFQARFRQLAQVAAACQRHEMVPLILLQVPWRDPGESLDYFCHSIKCLAIAVRDAHVVPKQLLLETRPPVGLSAQEERSLQGTARISLGLEIGRRMFETIEEAFGGDSIAGFCVAGGSTKGDLPTAMEDDTQNAVRQGMRDLARQNCGIDLCFWEMGAKLMLQPKVGRLWVKGPAGRDAARELFCVNAEDMSDEIKVSI